MATTGQAVAEAVAAEVRRGMERSGLTADAVAAATGLSTSEVAERLSGRTPLLLEELAAIANLLGVTASIIVSRALD